MDQPVGETGQGGLPRSRPGSTGQEKPALRSAFALLAKELVWRYVLRFQPTKRPICVYASRRSGSTLLMEVISISPGVMFSDQPFCLYTASSANLNRLPIPPYGQFACLDPDEEEIFRTYLQDVLSGRVRANVPWKLWSREFHFRNDRICLKITDAKAMADWIDSEFDVQTVVSTRHPIAQSVSVAGNGWLTTGKGFLRNGKFVDRWLGNGLEGFCWDIYSHGSDLQRRIVDWALENLPLLQLLPQRQHWLYVSYEDLIAHTDQAISYLCEHLQLDNRQAMLRRVARPSRSTRRESTAERKQLIQQGDRHRLLNSWRAKMADDEVRDCFRILDRFEIGLYHPATALPDHRCVGRAGFDTQRQEHSTSSAREESA